MQLSIKHLVVPGGCSIGRDEEIERKIVTLLKEDRPQVQSRRNEDDAIEPNPFVDQMPGQAGGACRAVALSGQEEGRGPALVTSQVQADELPHRVDIALEAPELFLQVLFGGAAEPRAHRIDENQVSPIEPGVLVCNQPVGRRRHPPFRFHPHTFWTERTHVEPDC